MTLFGLISDTHGVLDPRVESAFENVERIVHAGDIGAERIIWELETIAPVTAVLGNCDPHGSPAFDYPGLARFSVEGVRFLLVHDRRDAGAVSRQDVDVVVFGHSHMPFDDFVNGVRWVNPGSASQYRRSPMGRSVALLEVSDSAVKRVEMVALNRFGEQRRIR